MAPERSVFLIGFMGAGKSRIGIALARELGVAFVDTDELVRATDGRPIDRIFAESGEARFRDIERQVLAHLDPDRGVVVACGGGLFADAETRRWLAQRGSSVWLDVPLDVIRERLARNRVVRPLWPADDPVGQRALFERRRATYWLARMRVDGRGSPEAVARRIRDRLRQVPC